jgi:hypothetical protein
MERAFNYRLCRARRVVENVFGIISAVFRVLRQPMLLEPDNASLVVMAIVHHNFLRNNEDSYKLYTPLWTFDEDEQGHVRPGSWRHDTALLPLVNRPRRGNRAVQQIRGQNAEYCTQEGSLIWQELYA